jgi:acyl-CoA thioesterase I
MSTVATRYRRSRFPTVWIVAIALSCLAFPGPLGARGLVHYVPLGDSYTIGQGSQKTESWPEVLTRHLRDSGIPIELTVNPARSGYTAEDVIEHELPVLEASDADFVTLLIGTNDWARGVDGATFHRNLVVILDRAQRKLGPQGRLLLLTIPDFGASPAGPRYAEGRDVGQGIAAFNEIIRGEARGRRLEIVDLFPLSRTMGPDASFFSRDGLHPSAKGYAAWEREIFPAARRALSK